MTKERNGTVTKWATVIGILALGGGWLGNAFTIRENLKTNIAEDLVVHNKLQQSAVQNREAIINLQADLRYIREGIDEIKGEIKK